MTEQASVLGYNCPCCGAALVFDNTQQKLLCNSCDNTFPPETLQELYETDPKAQDHWEVCDTKQWSQPEQEQLQTFLCPSCAGEILSDANTAATFCPYCENPAILPGRLTGGLKPDGVIPFQRSKEDAKVAFANLCKGKPLLPKGCAEEQRLEKITGIYVPFWLYNCSVTQDNKYRATQIIRWSDSRYHYAKTNHFLLRRAATAKFDGIPMDASCKIDNAIMESIEPFDYSQAVDFDAAYLAGFFADKYDVDSSSGEARVRQRVESTMDDLIRSSTIGYATVTPLNKSTQISHGKAKYILLPVWMLHSKYKNKTYVFAMNGQTGKITGTFPICPRRSAAWFAGICAVVTALAALIQFLV